MEPQSSAPPRHWALLIGINFYGYPDIPNLRGAVEDVRVIQQYLLAQGVVKIRCFTATEPLPTEPQDPSAASVPIEDPSDRPTYDNILRYLESIVQQSKAGDKVYIHFSGHGVRPPMHQDEVKNRDSGDLILAVLDQSKGLRYLRTVEMIEGYVKPLINKQTFVTVTLDCCCSGSVVRHGRRFYSTVRGIPFDPRIDAAFPKGYVDGMNNSEVLRGATPRSTHLLLSPAAYVMLVACNQHEIAEEIWVKSGNRKYFHGAFSYNLVQALRSYSGQTIAARRLLEQIRCKVHLQYPLQNPALFGDPDVTFFGGPVEKPGMDFIFASKRAGKLVLSAGVAHGVLKDDEFCLWPAGSGENEAPTAHALATNVDQLESEIVIQDVTDITASSWWAKRVSLKSWRAHVRIMIDEDHGRFLELVERTRFLKLVQNDQDSEHKYDYCVTKLPADAYQVLDQAMQAIDLVELIPSGTPAGISRVVRILEHLAFFRYVASIENESPDEDFDKTFSISISSDDGPVVQCQDIRVRREGTLNLHVENRGQNTLHLAVLLMSPLWGIEDILSGSKGQSYRVIPPKAAQTDVSYGASGKRKIGIEMSIDEVLTQRGQTTCRDTIKVFVTSIASTFSSLQQKDITEISGSGDDLTRGSYRDLSTFLASLSEPCRGEAESEPAQLWSVRTFYVETS